MATEASERILLARRQRVRQEACDQAANSSSMTCSASHVPMAGRLVEKLLLQSQPTTCHVGAEICLTQPGHGEGRISTSY